MTHFKASAPGLFYSFPLQVEEQRKIDSFLQLLDSSGVYSYLNSPDSGGRPAFDSCTLLAIVLLGFALGKASLREIESACKNDLRFIYLVGDKAPSYVTISRFISTVIAPRREQIFALIVKAIFKRCELNMDTVFLDGTKQEARPNKYKFVWKPTSFHQRLSDKIRSLLTILGLSNDIPNTGFVPSSLIIKKLEDAENLEPSNFEGGEKTLNRMRKNLSDYLLKSLEYEEKEAICGPNRNSYYKTDTDATAMCLKRDYYSGLGSNMHAAYSVQAIVSCGFIVSYLVSQERSDSYMFKDALLSFYSMYGFFPKELCADSGYGMLSNYEFCEEHNITAYVKYTTWSGENTGRNPPIYEFLGNGSIRCLGQRIGYETTLENRHPKKAGGVFYLVEGCTGCEFMPYCRRFMKEKVGTEKIFEINPRFAQLKQKARDLLLSPRGIEMRVNRSCQVEGAFGNMKQNLAYTRCRRTSIERVSTEIALTCLGINIRKYMRFTLGKTLPKFWIAPPDLEPGVFKKPSAKRLANRVNKKLVRQANEIFRDKYKYKKRGR